MWLCLRSEKSVWNDSGCAVMTVREQLAMKRAKSKASGAAPLKCSPSPGHDDAPLDLSSKRPTETDSIDRVMQVLFALKVLE